MKHDPQSAMIDKQAVLTTAVQSPEATDSNSLTKRASANIEQQVQPPQAIRQARVSSTPRDCHDRRLRRQRYSEILLVLAVILTIATVLVHVLMNT